MKRVLFSLAVAAAMLLPTAGSNHPQSTQGDVIVFDHKTGNEWWVEVILGGSGGASAAKVEAMDTDGPWVTLTKRSWGAWAASFHIEAGHQVRFRASWSDGDVVTSCWFDHPSGEERCAAAPWRATLIGDAGRSHGASDIAVGDVDRDGQNEVLVPNANGLWFLEWSARGWLRNMPISNMTDFGRVAIGDVEGDGWQEVYASRGGTVLRFDRDGDTWRSQVVADFGIYGVGSMSVGDIEDDGLRELYVGIMALDGPVYRIHFDSQSWRPIKMAELAGGTNTMWFGDGNNDGDVELYIGSGWRGLDEVWQIDGRPGDWHVTEIVRLELGTGVSGIVVGDGDRDGRREVYATAPHPSAPVFRIRLTSTGWQMDRVATLPSFGTDLAFGDGENDGASELYASASDGHVYQVTGRTGGYVVEDLVATRDPYLSTIAIGDGDNDGKREAYVAGFDFSTCCPPHNVYQVANHPIPPPPGTGFDAAFKNPRGNEWWVQVGVSATGGNVGAVSVRFDGGDWRPMGNMGWGWATSVRVPDGTVVQFRATSTTGASDLSECYRWIPPQNQDASKVSCASPPAFDASFSGVKGNEWWVQVNVGANQPLAGVDARVNCGSFVPLTFHSWGAWAKSFHIPDGSKVDFRARSTSGATDFSGGYVWPEATPTGGC